MRDATAQIRIFGRPQVIPVTLTTPVPQGMRRKRSMPPIDDGDRSAAGRTRSAGEPARAGESLAKPDDPQPVVFHRAGVNLDQRPVALRHHQATERYREDGDPRDRNGDNDGDSRRR